MGEFFFYPVDATWVIAESRPSEKGAALLFFPTNGSFSLPTMPSTQNLLPSSALLLCQASLMCVFFFVPTINKSKL